MVNKKKATPKKSSSKKKEEKLIPFSSLGLGDGSSLSPKEDIMERIERYMLSLDSKTKEMAEDDCDCFNRIRTDGRNNVIRALDVCSDSILAMVKLNPESERAVRIQSLFSTLKLLEACGVISISNEIYRNRI